MEACRSSSCVNRNDCVTFRPPGQPPSLDELTRLGLQREVQRAWEPFHVPLDRVSCWSLGRSQRRAAEDAVLRATFPEAD
eukprot:2643929-Prymnesium_polylepis.1